MDNVRKETHAVSVITNQHQETCAVVRNKKDDRLLPQQNSKAKTDEGSKNLKNTSRDNEESSSDKRSDIPCRCRICKNPSCKFRHPVPKDPLHY